MAEDDPAGQASAKLGQHLALAAALAQAIAQLRALRAAERDRTDRQAAATARAELRTRHATDRFRWAPVLDPSARSQLDLEATATAWVAARAWPDDPEADRAATAAETRLRQLRPDAMQAYDQAVANGADPLQAMRQTQQAFDQPPARTGRPGPDRPAISSRAAVIDGEVLASRTAVGVARESYPDPRPQLTAEPTAATTQPATTRPRPPIQQR